MRIYSLDEVYADPRAAILKKDTAAHRQRVKQALAPEEPIHAFWWDRDITGLVLFTDRQILQFPRIGQRQGLIGYVYRYETWVYPYTDLAGIECVGGSLLEMPRLILHRHGQEDALIILNGGKRADHEALAAMLRQLLDGWQASPGSYQADEHPTMSDSVMQLRELYDLLQAGALTEDEYRRAKAQLLQDRPR
jgi:hypothetical protein